MTLLPGTRLKSAADDTELIVVRAPVGEVDLACGGLPMLAFDAERRGDAQSDPALQGGTPLGKRFTDAAGSLEVLCTKAGTGTLTLDGTVLEIKVAKALPSSD